MKLAIGSVLVERYRIEAVLGSGAMGTVYRARHLKIGRAFAIKVLHRELLKDPKVLRRFDREAEIAGTLDHPNVVCVVDAGETASGERYLAMELAEGDTLGQLITNNGPLPGPRVLRIVQQLCDGLAHAHDRGLVHRDFKPDNVIVHRDRDGREVPRIVDFGIAVLGESRSSAETERLTTAGLVLGTPHYMAPEHARGVTIDHRADLFALGVVCFEMLTGRMPFDGDGPEVARANLSQETPAMGVRVPDVDVDPLLEAFTRKLMMKSPNRRPQTARDARRLLDLIVSDRAAAAKELGVETDLEISVSRRAQPITAEVSQPIASKPIEPERRRSARWPLAAAAASIVSLASLTCALARREIPSTPPRVALAPSEELVAIEVGTQEREPAVPMPVIAKVPLVRAKPSTKAVATAATVDPSAQQIAALYTAVGRALRKYENGDPAVQELWIRYRRIRLNEVIATPDARRATKATLDQLREKLESM